MSIIGHVKPSGLPYCFVVDKMEIDPHLKKGGWGNGYVVLPPGHLWYGMSEEEIPLDDITYADSINGMWVIGFDTLSQSAIWSEEKVKARTQEILSIANHYTSFKPSDIP